MIDHSVLPSPTSEKQKKKHPSQESGEETLPHWKGIAQIEE